LSISLGSFLGLLLLINLILKFSIDAENKTLAQKEKSYKIMLARVDSLRNEVNEKKSFLTEAGWIESSKISFMADKIASTIPETIKLTEMSLYPKNDNLSVTQKKMVFDNHTVLVAGRCSKPTELNPWIKALKSFKWISNASVMNYIYDEKEKQGKFIVEVKID
jgi:Tfp pilus assembly protein PilN